MKLTIVKCNTRDKLDMVELIYPLHSELRGINQGGYRPTLVSLTRKELSDILKNPKLGINILTCMADNIN